MLQPAPQLTQLTPSALNLLRGQMQVKFTVLNPLMQRVQTVLAIWHSPQLEAQAMHCRPPNVSVK
jgi:hypothetical protein